MNTPTHIKHLAHQLHRSDNTPTSSDAADYARSRPGGIFTTVHPLTNSERIAAWRWRQRLKPARANKQPDRLSGWEIFGDLVAVLAFLLVLAIGLAAMWALQSVSDANAAEERCFQAALSEHNYCRSQADWGDR